ncbi:MAG: hypothetical protein AABX99_01355 [Nanoarchaeota archaeon]
MEMDTQVRDNETLREHELRRVYNDEVRPLINEKKYDEAFSFFVEHPEIKLYLSHAELMGMYNYVESKYSNVLLLCKKINELFDNSEKLKGLEGKTEEDGMC